MKNLPGFSVTQLMEIWCDTIPLEMYRILV